MLVEKEESRVLQNAFPHINICDESTPVLGVATLCARLQTLLAERVRINIPKLQADMYKKRAAAEERLDDLGRVAKDSGFLLSELRSQLQHLTPHLDQELTKHIEEFRQALHDSKDLVTEEWTEKHFRPSVFQPPFFQGMNAFAECANDISAMWRPILDKLIESCALVLQSERMKLLGARIPDGLKMGYFHCWSEQQRQLVQLLNQSTSKALNYERRFGTMNHYLTSKFQEKMILPHDVIETFVHKFTQYDFLRLSKVSDIAEARDELTDALRSVIETEFEKFASKTILEQTKHRLNRAVQAHWWVEHKTFGDMVLKCAHSDILDGWNRWVSDVAHNAELRMEAKEERAVISNRLEASKVVKAMDACIGKIESMRISGQN